MAIELTLPHHYMNLPDNIESKFTELAAVFMPHKRELSENLIKHLTSYSDSVNFNNGNVGIIEMEDRPYILLVLLTNKTELWATAVLYRKERFELLEEKIGEEVKIIFKTEEEIEREAKERVGMIVKRYIRELEDHPEMIPISKKVNQNNGDDK